MRGRKVGGEDVVRCEPGVKADEGRSGCAQGSVPEGSDALLANSVSEEFESVGASLGLLGRLEGVDGGERHPERRAGQTGKDGLDRDGPVNALEQGEDASVGGRVTEPREGSLEEGGRESSVEAGKLSLGPQPLGHLARSSSAAVLDVHEGPERHERKDLDDHGHGAGDAAARSALEGLLQVDVVVEDDAVAQDCESGREGKGHEEGGKDVDAEVGDGLVGGGRVEDGQEGRRGEDQSKCEALLASQYRQKLAGSIKVESAAILSTYEYGVLKVGGSGQVGEAPERSDADGRDGRKPPEDDAENGSESFLLLAVLVPKAKLSSGAEQLDDGVRPAEPGENGAERRSYPAGVSRRPRERSKEEVLNSGDEGDGERDESGEDERVQVVRPVRPLRVSDRCVGDSQKGSVLVRRRRSGNDVVGLRDMSRDALLAVELDGGGLLDNSLDDWLQDSSTRAGRGSVSRQRTHLLKTLRTHRRVSEMTAKTRM